MSIVASCHCGAVRLKVAALPASLTRCSCSICHRLGAHWAYYRRDEVTVDCSAADIGRYSWGDRSIAFCHCRQCGCATHYESIDPAPDSRLAINARMMDPAAVAGIRLRTFDGASSWRYLDADSDDAGNS